MISNAKETNHLEGVLFFMIKETQFNKRELLQHYSLDFWSSPTPFCQSHSTTHFWSSPAPFCQSHTFSNAFLAFLHFAWNITPWDIRTPPSKITQNI